jgi:DNA-binding CsgD family transcriptional regulator
MKVSIAERYGQEISGVTKETDLKGHLVKFGRALGFDTISVMAVFDSPSGPSQFHIIDNTPDPYRESYEDPALSSIDPVMQHCKRYSETLVWDQSTYVSRGYGSLWEHQAKFGYRTGIALALHSMGGKHFFIGVDRDKPLNEPAAVVANMSAELRAFAAHARAAAFRFFEPKFDLEAARTSLSELELACLRWSMNGYSSSETGQRMNLRDTAVDRLICSAMEKLGCTTKYHAVIQALRLRLI